MSLLLNARFKERPNCPLRLKEGNSDEHLYQHDSARLYAFEGLYLVCRARAGAPSITTLGANHLVWLGPDVRTAANFAIL